MVKAMFLGLDFSCALGSLANGQIPDKDCLLPLTSIWDTLSYSPPPLSNSLSLWRVVFSFDASIFRGHWLCYKCGGLLDSNDQSRLKRLSISFCYSFVAIMLVAVIYYFSQLVGTKTWIRALLYCAIAPTLLAGQIDTILFEALYASQHAIFFFARFPQILENFKNGSTGELSFLTSLMNCAGSLVRVFTSIQEKAPMSVVLGSAIGVLTNGTITHIPECTTKEREEN